jgi:hypothetical protein
MLGRLMAGDAPAAHDADHAAHRAPPSRTERTMQDKDDWLEDVRRWYYGGNAPASDITADESTSGLGDIGYETAQPALQARHWLDAPPPQIVK